MTTREHKLDRQTDGLTEDVQNYPFVSVCFARDTKHRTRDLIHRRHNRESTNVYSKVERRVMDIANSRNLVSTIGAQASSKKGEGPGVRKGKRSLLASHYRCKCSMEAIHNSMKVTSVSMSWNCWSLIGWEVIVGQGSECYLTFVRGILHIAE